MCHGAFMPSAIACGEVARTIPFSLPATRARRLQSLDELRRGGQEAWVMVAFG
jgi:hypothetical protein